MIEMPAARLFSRDTGRHSRVSCANSCGHSFQSGRSNNDSKPSLGPRNHGVGPPLGLVEALDCTSAGLDRMDRAAFFARFNKGETAPYFYEPFLEAFDPNPRKQPGVWYPLRLGIFPNKR